MTTVKNTVMTAPSSQAITLTLRSNCMKGGSKARTIA